MGKHVKHVSGKLIHMKKKIKINSKLHFRGQIEKLLKKVKLKVYINSIMGFYLEKKKSLLCICTCICKMRKTKCLKTVDSITGLFLKHF